MLTECGVSPPGDRGRPAHEVLPPHPWEWEADWGDLVRDVHVSSQPEKGDVVEEVGAGVVVVDDQVGHRVLLAAAQLVRADAHNEGGRRSGGDEYLVSW